MTFRPRGGRPPIILYLTWLILIGAAVGGFLSEAFSITFVAAGTLLLSLVPVWVGEKVGVTLPTAFVSAIAAFLCATLLLGAGWAYLKGRQNGPLTQAIHAFVDKNRRLFGDD